MTVWDYLFVACFNVITVVTVLEWLAERRIRKRSNRKVEDLEWLD